MSDDEEISPEQIEIMENLGRYYQSYIDLNSNQKFLIYAKEIVKNNKVIIFNIDSFDDCFDDCVKTFTNTRNYALSKLSSNDSEEEEDE